MSRAVRLLVNPVSGGGRGEAVGRAVAGVLEAAGARVSVRRSAGPGDLPRLAQAAFQEPDTLVVVIGGDGSLHEVLAGAPEPLEPRPRLAVFGVGTGNDFLKMLGHADEAPAAAARRLLDAPLRAVDLIELRAADGARHRIINNLGFGFLAEATRRTDAHHERRGRRGGGRLPYILGGLGALRHHEPVVATLRLTSPARTEPEVLEGPFSLVHVGSGRYCGGGIDLTPEARIDDGRMDLCAVSARGRGALAWLWPRLERGGGGLDGGVQRRSLTGLEIECGRVLAHLDGEVTELDGPLSLKLLPGAIDIACP